MSQFNEVDESLVQSGFHIIDNFLDEKTYQELRDYSLFLHQDGQFRSAKIGRRLTNQEALNIRNDNICWLDEHANNQAVHFYLSQLAALKTKLNQSLFLSLVELEAHFAIYQPGSFYKKHVDQFKNTSSRLISSVFYLNEDWQDDFGGELKLYNKEDEFIVTVNPKPNRFICFKSDLPHEVCLTHRPRYSIAGWLKTRG